MNDIIAEYGLIDLGFNGSIFTWSNGRFGTCNIQARLDRGLVNGTWRIISIEKPSQNGIFNGFVTNMTVAKNVVANSDCSKIRLLFVMDLQLCTPVTICNQFTTTYDCHYLY